MRRGEALKIKGVEHKYFGSRDQFKGFEHCIQENKENIYRNFFEITIPIVGCFAVNNEARNSVI